MLGTDTRRHLAPAKKCSPSPIMSTHILPLYPFLFKIPWTIREWHCSLGLWPPKRFFLSPSWAGSKERDLSILLRSKSLLLPPGVTMPPPSLSGELRPRATRGERSMVLKEIAWSHTKCAKFTHHWQPLVAPCPLGCRLTGSPWS